MNNTELTLDQLAEVSAGYGGVLINGGGASRSIIYPDHKYRNLEALMSSGGSPGPYLPGPSCKKC
tara:strand:- start:177 stop:371 length:195 start_codon:yes stop_codon:yes gene_type:complete